MEVEVEEVEEGENARLNSEDEAKLKAKMNES